MKQYLLSVYQPDGARPRLRYLRISTAISRHWTRSCAQPARGCSRAGCTRRAPPRSSTRARRGCR